MMITKQQLKRIIKEEYLRLCEDFDMKAYHAGVRAMQTEAASALKPAFASEAASALKAKGYKEVKEIVLPDGEYGKGGSGYHIEVFDERAEWRTGYIILTTTGIRGYWDHKEDRIKIRRKKPIVDYYYILYNPAVGKDPCDSRGK
jgi:hypothetical protein